MERLLTADDIELRKRVLRFTERDLRQIAAEVDENDNVPWNVVELLRKEQLFRLLFPEEYGGIDGAPRCVSVCLVREQLSRVCCQADSLFVMQGISAYPILAGGSSQLKERYLPLLAAGKDIAGFGLTEPTAGSDVAAIQTTAVRSDGGYVLNGAKRFISNAPEAGVYTVFAKTDPAMGVKGISAFVVEKTSKGFVPGRCHRLLAAHAVGEFVLENCELPESNLVGSVGGGFKLAMATLDMYRTTVGAAAVGLAQAALELAVRYAKARVQFGQPLAALQSTQFKLADMATDLEAARLLVFSAAMAKDAGETNTAKRASMAKLYASEMAGRVADQSLQIHGANGLDKLLPIERVYRQTRALRIYEGASEIQRLVIARQVLQEAESKERQS